MLNAFFADNLKFYWMGINIFFKIIFFHTLSYTKITQNFKVIACFSMCDQCLMNKKNNSLT